jgi:hypothetical protein
MRLILLLFLSLLIVWVLAAIWLASRVPERFLLVTRIAGVGGTIFFLLLIMLVSILNF